MGQIGKRMDRDLLAAAALQVFLLAAAVLFWLFQRGNAYQKVFSAEELAASDGAVVTEGITADEAACGEGVFLTTPPLALEKGIYQVQIDYDASQAGSVIFAETSELGSLEFHSPAAELNPAGHSAVMTMELARGVTDLRIQANFSGSGQVSVLRLGIAETSGRYKKNLFYALAACLLVDLALVFRRSGGGTRKVIFALTGIFLAVCYPLYNDYLTVGHDLPFHLLRIEGIAEGFRTGSGFPVRIHPFWARGYGYAVGVMYGDILLYFPAFLRLLGFSVQSAYKIFAAAANLGTVLIAYLAFRRMFQSRRIGVLGSLVYSLSLYRLVDTYTRASVGEYLAMMFFPLVLCGFYLIFAEASEKNWKRYALLTALGLTGLIQNHVLSCEMTAFLILCVCLLLLRRVFRRYVFRSLVLGAVATVLLNLGFLVPFLEFYNGGLYFTSDQWTGNVTGFFQENGLFPIQLFSLFQNSNGGAFGTAAGVAGEVTTGVGMVFLLGIFLFGYLRIFHLEECRRLKNFVPAEICLLLGGVLLYMSTSLFPWEAIASLGEPVRWAIYGLQFPWRLLAPATVLLTFVLCFALSAMWDILGREISRMVLTAAAVLFAVNIGWYLYDFSYSKEPYRVYQGYEMNTMQLYSYEYLPADTDPEKIGDGGVSMENIAWLEDYQKQGTNITCRTAALDADGYVDFPLFFYPHYKCVETASGRELAVSSGYNGTLRVTVPAGFEGEIRVFYAEPWYWRAAEAASLLAFLGSCAVLLRERRIGKGSGKNDGRNDGKKVAWEGENR